MKCFLALPQHTILGMNPVADSHCDRVSILQGFNADTFLFAQMYEFVTIVMRGQYLF